MNRPTVLIVDNDRSFLDGCVANVRSAGFQVLKADDISLAKEQIASGRVHVVVIDKRLMDDNDVSDQSGYQLALDVPSAVGIILQSNFLTVAFASDEPLRKRGVQFIDKTRPNAADELVERIQYLFQDSIRVNFDQTWVMGNRDDIGAADIIAGLRTQTEGTSTFNPTYELSDLFGKLLYEYSSIRIPKLLYKSNDELGLLVYAIKDERVNTFAVVISIKAHNRHLSMDDIEMQLTSLAIGRRCTTVHFSAVTLRLEADPDTLMSISQLVGRSDKRFKTAVNSLLTQQLGKYRRLDLNSSNRKDTPFDEDSVCTLLSIPRLQSLESEIHSKLKVVCVALPKLNWNVAYNNDELALALTRYSDNLTIQRFASKMVEGLSILFSCQQSVSPGIFNIQDILVDPKNNTWLIANRRTYQLPSAWDITAIEASIRFDLIYKNDGLAIQTSLAPGDFIAIEGLLSWTSEEAWTNFDFHSLPKSCWSILDTVEQIRGFANSIGVVQSEYRAMLQLHFIGRLLNVSTHLPTNRECQAIVGLLHASMLGIRDGERLGTIHKEKRKSPGNGKQIAIIDEKLRSTYIRGRQIRLAKTDFHMLEYFLKHACELCSHEDLYKHLYTLHNSDSFRGPITDLQRARLTQVIHRLREAIEENPSSPRLLLNEREDGYRFCQD